MTPGFVNPGGGGVPRPRGPGYGGDSGGQGSSDGSNLLSVPPRSNTFNAADQIPQGMTPEIQTIAIEANRIATQEQVEKGELAPLPITELTP